MYTVGACATGATFGFNKYTRGFTFFYRFFLQFIFCQKLFGVKKYKLHTDADKKNYNFFTCGVK